MKLTNKDIEQMNRVLSKMRERKRVEDRIEEEKESKKQRFVLSTLLFMAIGAVLILSSLDIPEPEQVDPFALPDTINVSITTSGSGGSVIQGVAEGKHPYYRSVDVEPVGSDVDWWMGERSFFNVTMVKRDEYRD